MIVPPPRRRLVLNLLQEHFGDLVEHVAAVILKADDDGLTLREIIAHALASPPAHLQPTPTAPHIKTGLLKLLQHNLLDIKSTWVPANSTKKQKLPYIIRYQLNHDEALLRLRFARYIELAREVFGDEGEVIMEEILVNGRIRLDQSLDTMAFNLAEQRRLAKNDPDAPAADEDELEDLKDSLKTTFLNMAKTRYLVRVHPLDLNKKKTDGEMDGEAEFQSSSNGASTSPADSGVSVRRAKRKGPASAAADSSVPIEVQLMMQAEDAGSSSAATAPEGTTEAVVSESGAKRRRLKRAKLPTVGVAAAAAPGLTIDNGDLDAAYLKEENAIWRAGVTQLTRELRHRTCIQFASESINVVAQAIVKAMLAHSSPHERDANEATSFPMTARDLFEIPAVHDAVPSPRDRWKMLLNFLTAMCQHPSGMLTKTASESFDPSHPKRAGDGGTYSVHMQNIVKTLQRKSIHAFIHEKYGAASARLVRVITEQRQLEQKTLGEMALLPAAETRSRLFEMYRDKLLNLQEIPKRTDYNPQFTLYCWSVDDTRLTRRLVERTMDTTVKLRARRKDQADSHKDLIARSDQLVEQHDLDKFDRVSRSLDRLDRGILHLDRMLMLFDQF
ncbi:Aste57867_21989 [Aphanomyces stellatus]|uniref:DNA-directed RNA polymerase III subunit RPC3 n=1 Tax=Aphanomyces stellatus TaxID=120398 RepID=A0A485LNW3_9STRA|nr:hypothetical protein As57867_021920 [Aphanomyces stellatus]VFT98657.1 Aste57867_21989 [Aphanomyces stellatus]